MGFRQSHKCDLCGLAGTISGGRDSGFYVEVETRYCPHCQSLNDVSVRFWCKDALPELLPPDRVDELLACEGDFGLCLSCKKPGGKPWTSGTPCPRCGGNLHDTGEHFEQWI